MANIGSLAIQISANTQQFQQGVAGATNEVQRFSQTAAVAGQATQQSLAATTTRSEQLQRTLQRVAPAFDVRAVLSATQSAESTIGALGHTASATAMSFGVFGMIASIGLGAATVGVTALWKILNRSSEEAKALNAAAAKAMVAIIDGSQTAARATAQLRTSILSKDLGDAITTFLGDTSATAANALENAILRSVQNSARAIEALQRARQTPALQNLQREENANQLRGTIREATQDLEFRALSARIGEDAAARERFISQHAQQQGLFRDQAIVDLSGPLSQLTSAQEEFRVDTIIGGLTRLQETVGMTADQLQIYELALNGASQETIASARVMQGEVQASRANQELEQLTQSINLRRQRLGLSQEEIQVQEILARGATVVNALQIQQSIAMLREAEAIQQLGESAARMIEANRTPLERFNDTIAELDWMRFLGGLGEITFAEEDYARAVANAVEQLERQDRAGSRTPQGPQSLEAGSAAALQAINRAQRESTDRNRDPLERLKQLAEAQAARDQAQVAYQRRIAEAVESGLINVVR